MVDGKQETQVVIMELGGSEYGIPADKVKEIVRLVEITPMPESVAFVKGVIDYRGTMAVVIDLAMRLGLEPSAYNLETQLIIVENKAGLTGLVVDRVADVAMIDSSAVLRGREPAAQSNGITTGAYEDGDRLVLLLDIEIVLDFREGHVKKND